MSNKRARGSSSDENEDIERSNKTLREENEDVEMADSPTGSELVVRNINGSKDAAWLLAIGEADRAKAESLYENSSKTPQDQKLKENTLKEIKEREQSFVQLQEIPMDKPHESLEGSSVWNRRKEWRATSIACVFPEA